MPSPNLYALIVGIGAYERVRPLRGPVNDALSVNDYLGLLATHFTLNIQVLTDQQANKTAIIDGFQTHLAQAGPDDTVLFYFAGHGTQETADPAIWLTETDGQLECLVCHDAGTANTWDFLLADKELRFLIGQVGATGAHVVTAFDCCHSGDNTRSDVLLMAALAEQDVRERRLTFNAPQRPYNGFCFHTAVPVELIKSQGIETALPQGAHVQMAACESDESAVEVNGEGVFTKHLLAVLGAAHGQLSYGDLHNRVRQTMRFGYEQHLRIYTPAAGSPSDGGGSLLSRGFLNQPLDADTLTASVMFNRQEGWLLDVGAIHGVGKSDQTIYLYDRDGERYPLGIERIGVDYSVVTLPDAIRPTLDKMIVYRATVAGLLSQPIRLQLLNHGGLASDLPDLLSELTNRAGACFVTEDDPAKADYCLHVRNGLYYITYPDITDSLAHERPLIRPVQADNPQAFEGLAEDLRHLARWHYLTHLRNPEVTDPVLNVVVETTSEQSIPLTEAHPAPLPVQFTRINPTKPYLAQLRIRLTNPNDQALYCTVLYLSRDFGSFLDFLPTNYRLEAGQNVALGLADRKAPTGRQTTLRLGLEEVIRQYNWPTVIEQIKLLITTEPLSEKTLAFIKLNALPSPPVLADRNKPDGMNRGAFEIDADETEPLPEWSTQTLTLQLINPLYNQVQVDEVSQILQPLDDGSYTVQTDFALGLYYKTTPTDGLLPDLQLRDELVLVRPSDNERGLWNDLKVGIANRIANQLRNRQYRQNLIRYPDRIRIVAEGDSWFHYPFLLRDIVDYLSGVYTVYNVASAGATMDDYLKEGSFLEAIAQVKPAFFLLSGGGDELFGEAFPRLIRDVPRADVSDASRYVSDAIDETLAQLNERFTRMLRLVQQGYPKVNVLIHGYDYVIPANTAMNRQPGWLGKILVAKGITDADEREAIIRYVVDAFNNELRRVSAAYTNVTYLDLRSTIQRTSRPADYWYDEVHPNDKGFLRLASRYVSHINRREGKTDSIDPAPADAIGEDGAQTGPGDAPERWSTAYLESKRQSGDPLADHVIETLLAENQKGEIDQIFQVLVRNRHFPNPAFDVLPDPVKRIVENYFGQTRELPANAEPFKLMIASEVFKHHGPKILFILLCKSLPLCYTCWRGAKVLYRTGRLRVNDGSLDAFSRRVMETAQFVVDMMTHNNFEHDGTAIVATQKVRLMHATIRYFAQQRAWDIDTYGIPINQEDLAGTLLSFSVTILDGLDQLGVMLTPEERSAYMHLWSVVGTMIGIDSELVVEDESEARALMKAIMDRQAGPSMEGAELTNACIELMNERMVVGPLKRLSPYFVRFFIGDHYADMLRIATVDSDNSFVLEAAQWLDKGIRGMNERNLLLAALGRSLSHSMVTGFMRFTNAAKHEQFYLPSALTDDWEAVTPDFRIPPLDRIEDMINYLDKLARHFRAQNNPMGLFCAVYKLVTERVAAGIRLGLFENPVEMEQVDVGFGNRYFEAINLYFDGKPAPGPWQLSFDAARTLLTTDQHIFSAANAHITYDLPIVVAEVYRGKDIERFKDDFTQMNALFDDLYHQMNDNVGRIFRPFGRILTYFSDQIIRLESEVMKKGRELAWQKSGQLHRATDTTEHARLLAQLETDATALGDAIVHPPVLLRMPLQRIAKQEFGTAAHKIDVMLRTALLPEVA
jgi:lysophospholipase L1-like esterase